MKRLAPLKVVFSSSVTGSKVKSSVVSANNASDNVLVDNQYVALKGAYISCTHKNKI